MRRYTEWILRHRLFVIGLALVATAVLARQVTNLRVIIDPNNFLPADHPYVVATDEVERRFGSEYVVLIGLTAASGDAFQPHILAKVQRITAAITDLPGVVKGNVLSLSARKAKDIVGTDDGMIVRQLYDTVPVAREDLDALRAAVHRNDAYVGTIVSADNRTTAIIADFKDPGAAGFRSIVDSLTPILDRERDATVRIAIGGLPAYLTHFELNSQRMVFLFPLAVLIAGLIHYEAFRTIQGLMLPLVTALLAVVWALGIMGLAGVPMDVFNITTPILILAVAAGHAVQILKRYYEEYGRLRRNPAISPAEANQRAVVESITRTGPVMLTAGAVAVCGFLSLVVFKLSAVRTFGVFTGLGILSALVIEMTLVPALRSILPAPGLREQRREQERRIWDRLASLVADWVTAPSRTPLYLAAAAIAVVSAIGASRVVVDENFKDIFFESLPVVQDDDHLNQQLGGTNTVYMLVDGGAPDALKRPDVLRAIEETQRYVEQQPHVGKTLSIVDFVKRMNRSMHGDDPTWNRIPEGQDLVSQYLFLYSMSGDPGDFDTYVDNDYRSASLWVFMRTDSHAYFGALKERLDAFVSSRFPPDVHVSFGGSVAQAAAVRETIIESKVLNIAQMAGVVLVIASLVFRSLLGGILVLIPLAAAVLANFGVMGWFGIPLNAPNSLTSAMAIGIGADYAIYLMYRIREEFRQGASEADALRAALATAGKAVMFVATAVAGGYAVLLLSRGFYFHIWMAILIGVAMLVSSIAAITLIPSLILTLRPKFIFGRAQTTVSTPQPVGTALLLAMLCGLASGASAQTPSPADIMSRSLQVTKVVDSVSDAQFTLINRQGQERERRTISTTKLQPNGLDNSRMVQFLSPPDVKGTSVLLVEHSSADDDLWIYLPALKKVRRLVSSNKKDSFAGTDFSYGDVIGHKVDEWTHRIVEEEAVDGQPCYVVESVPTTDAVSASSGYSKRRSWIRKDNFVQAKGEIWDRAGQLLKVTTFKDITLVDPSRQRWQPMRLESANVQTGHRTLITFGNFKVGQGIKDDFFTTRTMEIER